MSKTKQFEAIDALARPWEHGWELHIDGHGVTQVRVLAKAAQQVRDYVATVTGVDVPDGTEVRLRYELGGLETQLTETRERTERAANLQVQAATATRDLVAGLRAVGISVSDIAVLLDVSRGRVSQLLAG